ncbi:DUF1957 domain-containing protein [Treponema phagedenis]|uniref:DUF1957 domain-containing protein n=1 Tax=Treponema phagedenis TaxID=162 RepID=A0A0B7GR54_TREPH|nr:1,4-alpha-glucan branching protein domain-containing protein [Treponema phagedenis]EFW37769.1 hypothetical protein HMPREF9554_01772 [Treponema phagedenis F0421]NVP24635.1 DUF1957 domain-containing protein [Treponema phagedenis]QEJ94606.1 DUF1957 domain-containing protein [Treponema phagedenis]QEJ97613.1 DUF1957 domain-containing protein [Treponema phagedenis]QEK00581.1 DUF1957 domain-containing protein [Treponema phagedenis]
MNKKNTRSIIFVFDLRLPYCRDSTESGSIAETWLFQEVFYNYLPLLRMCRNLEKEAIPFHFAMAISPVICEMLADSKIATRCMQKLELLIDLGKRELVRLENFPLERAQAEAVLHCLLQNKEDIENGYTILKSIDYFASRGNIELLATTATNCFLPFYQTMPEAIAAQIEMGLINYRKHFSTIPTGFWLPELGYNSGLEKMIKAYGFTYTVLETHSFLFSDRLPRRGVFEPSMAENGLIFLGRDRIASEEICGTRTSYANSADFADKEQDIGFILSEEYLQPLLCLNKERRVTGFFYRTKSGQTYDREKALRLAENQAAAFVAARKKIFDEVEDIAQIPHIASVCTFPISISGFTWAEGLHWLQTVFMLAAKDEEVQTALPDAFAGATRRLSVIYPFYGSLLDDGYAGSLISNENDWMYPYIRKATERMIDITERFPDDGGFKERLLNMAARDVLLSQSLFWPLLSGTGIYPEYATQECKDHIQAFTVVYESLGSGIVSSEWLTKREKELPLFAEINYRFFSKKK